MNVVPGPEEMKIDVVCNVMHFISIISSARTVEAYSYLPSSYCHSLFLSFVSQASRMNSSNSLETASSSSVDGPTLYEQSHRLGWVKYNAQSLSLSLSVFVPILLSYYPIFCLTVYPSHFIRSYVHMTFFLYLNSS